MTDLILGVVVLGVIHIICNYSDWIFNNRTCPPGKEIDWAAMNRDLVSGMSERDIKINCNHGVYDIPKK